MGELRADNPCFGCGGGNPHGMKLVFERDNTRRRFVGRFRLGAEFQGASGFIHGGIIATVLDEAMGKINRFNEVTAVTAELKVEYLRPVRVNEEIVVEGFQIDRNGKQLYYGGEIRNAEGKTLAKGTGRWVVVEREQFGKQPQTAADPG